MTSLSEEERVYFKRFLEVMEGGKGVKDQSGQKVAQHRGLAQAVEEDGGDRGHAQHQGQILQDVEVVKEVQALKKFQRHLGA
jgi:hypothetical protein